MRFKIQKQSKLTICMMALATIVALLPLINFPSCLITLIFIIATIGYKVSEPKSSFQHDHRSFLNGETADIFVNYFKNFKKQTQLNQVYAAWDKKEKNIIKVKNMQFDICKSLSSTLGSFHWNEKLYLGTIIVVALISLVSIIFENLCFTQMTLTCVVVFGFLFSTKDIAQVDVAPWEIREAFHSKINTLKKLIEPESEIYQWIQIQDKISTNELKFIPAICKKLSILPDNLAVRIGACSTDQKYYSELIRENDVHLFIQNYDAVLAIIYENEDVFESNGYIEIPESRVSLDDLGREFVGKTYRTYIKVLVNQYKNQDQRETIDLSYQSYKEYHTHSKVQDQKKTFDWHSKHINNYRQVIRGAIDNIE